MHKKSYKWPLFDARILENHNCETAYTRGAASGKLTFTIFWCMMIQSVVGLIHSLKIAPKSQELFDSQESKITKEMSSFKFW